MTTPVSDLAALLRSISPVLNNGVFIFASLPSATPLPDVHALATFREHEGVTLIVEEQRALQAGLPVLFRAAWITLQVHSDLHAVGLSAAVAGALTRANISCNIVAAAHHDHLFVPVDSAHVAVAVLQDLQRQAEHANAS
ncbi:MAG: ACT domain-containing protein [Dokdonella sp.]